MRTRAAMVLVAIFGTAAAGCGGDGSGESLPAERDAGSWKPWVIESGGAVKVPPPPRPGSQTERRDAEALRAAVKARTDAQERVARELDRRPVVEPWLENAMRFVAARPKDPPTASRNYALVSVAMHDAAVAAWHWKYRYRREAPEEDALVKRPADPSYPSEQAAIAGAASRVLAHLYPDEPAARLERQAEDVSRARVIAGVSYPSDQRAGLALGRAVARRVIRRADSDGADRKWDGRRPGRGPRYWEPPPGSAARPVQPLAGTWRTWVMRSGAQFRPPPPPAFGTREFLAEARKVMAVRDGLTAEQKRIARFWAGGEGTALPPGVWNQVVLRRLAREPLTTPRTTRLFALLNVAMADAGVAAWDAKYKYWNPRPENGIRDSLDPRWKPYLPTPFFPAYVSGHATYSAAAGEVLAHLYPGDAPLWRARAREAATSRLYGGIHWDIDNRAGAKMGRRIGRLVVARAKRDGAER